MSVEVRYYANQDSARRALRKWGIGAGEYHPYIMAAGEFDAAPVDKPYAIYFGKDGPINCLTRKNGRVRVRTLQSVKDEEATKNFLNTPQGQAIAATSAYKKPEILAESRITPEEKRAAVERGAQQAMRACAAYFKENPVISALIEAEKERVRQSVKDEPQAPSSSSDANLDALVYAAVYESRYPVSAKKERTKEERQKRREARRQRVKQSRQRRGKK